MKLNLINASLSALLFAGANPAFALDKIYSPNIEKGELAVEYSGATTFDRDNTKNNDQDHELEIEYGLNDWFQLQVAAGLTNAPGEGSKYQATEFGGIFQFFNQGEHWMDSGLKLMYVHAMHDSDADAIEAKLLLEKQCGKFLHRLNLGLEHDIGGNSQGDFKRSAAWSSRYRYSRHFEPGFEIQSDFGRASDHASFNKQEHFAGPALYGELLPNLKYEAAYFLGVTDAAPSSGARITLEYELEF